MCVTSSIDTGAMLEVTHTLIPPADVIAKDLTLPDPPAKLRDP